MSENKKKNKMSALIGSLTTMPKTEIRTEEISSSHSAKEKKGKKVIISASINKELLDKTKALSIKYDDMSVSGIIEDALTLFLDEFESEYGEIEVEKITKNIMPKIRGKSSNK